MVIAERCAMKIRTRCALQWLVVYFHVDCLFLQERVCSKDFTPEVGYI